MLTPVERVLILKGADLLRDVGPRHLLGLAHVARELDIFQGEVIYGETDPADALYIVVEGRVHLSTGNRMMSEVGPGEAFGTWSLVDDSARGHRAVCVEDGLALALHREEFYDLAAGDLTLLQELVRVLAKRLRTLVAERPEEARVEGEGVEKTEAMVESEKSQAVEAPQAVGEPGEAKAGAALAAAALGKPQPEGDAPQEPDAVVPPDEAVSSEGVIAPDRIESPAPVEPPAVSKAAGTRGRRKSS